MTSARWFMADQVSCCQLVSISRQPYGVCGEPSDSFAFDLHDNISATSFPSMLAAIEVNFLLDLFFSNY